MLVVGLQFYSSRDDYRGYAPSRPCGASKSTSGPTGTMACGFNGGCEAKRRAMGPGTGETDVENVASARGRMRAVVVKGATKRARFTVERTGFRDVGHGGGFHAEWRAKRNAGKRLI